MFPIETAGSFQKINYTEFIRIDGMAKYGVWHDLTSNINWFLFLKLCIIRQGFFLDINQKQELVK